MNHVPTPGLTADDARIRRIAADVVSSTLSIAVERSGEGKSALVCHWLAQLDIMARLPDPPAKRGNRILSDDDLRNLIREGRLWAKSHSRHGSPSAGMLQSLSDSLENEMLDAEYLRQQRDKATDKAADAIIATIDARLRWLRGQVAPDEKHPAEDDIDALRHDLVNAVNEALR